MTSKSGQAALDHVRALRVQHDAANAKRLAAAKIEAGKRGKERFDFAVVSKLVDVTSPISHQVAADAAAVLEREYYLAFPEVLTLRAFAEQKAIVASHESG
ncbi:MAG: hypothetical protein Q8O67_15795 [Deltaproteobacteria bacterium]|nr:hypothetical protein [Deltaproteobacteria bacterium]